MTVVDDTMSECAEYNCTSYYRVTEKTGSLNPQPNEYIYCYNEQVVPEKCPFKMYSISLKENFFSGTPCTVFSMYSEGKRTATQVLDTFTYRVFKKHT